MFDLRWMENLFKYQKVSKYYEHDCRLLNLTVKTKIGYLDTCERILRTGNPSNLHVERVWKNYWVMKSKTYENMKVNENLKNQCLKWINIWKVKIFVMADNMMLILVLNVYHSCYYNSTYNEVQLSHNDQFVTEKT